jgi:N-acetylneuraminate synthase
MRGGEKRPAAEEQVTIDFAFATVCSIAPIAEGEMLTKDNIWVKRPGTGKILAEHFESLLGKKATRAIAADEQLDFSDFI